MKSFAQPAGAMTPPPATPMPAAPLAQVPHGIDAAVKQLAKLPILGPALWLYAKDPEKKTLFLADTASQSKPARILPPVILEQCQLFTKGEIPFAFITWAFVSDEVDQRLRAGVAKFAPHEWKGGEHAWLIDVVSPFENAEPYLKACCEKFMAGKKSAASSRAAKPHGWRRLPVLRAERKGKTATCHRPERLMDRASTGVCGLRMALGALERKVAK